MIIGGKKHSDFAFYAGPENHRYSGHCVYLGLWRKASCAEGEITWLFEWSISTAWLPRVRAWGCIELCAFGRCWIFRL